MLTDCVLLFDIWCYGTNAESGFFHSAEIHSAEQMGKIQHSFPAHQMSSIDNVKTRFSIFSLAPNFKQKIQDVKIVNFILKIKVKNQHKNIFLKIKITHLFIPYKKK